MKKFQLDFYVKIKCILKFKIGNIYRNMSTITKTVLPSVQEEDQAGEGAAELEGGTQHSHCLVSSLLFCHCTTLTTMLVAEINTSFAKLGEKLIIIGMSGLLMMNIRYYESCKYWEQEIKPQLKFPNVHTALNHEKQFALPGEFHSTGRILF